MMARGRNLNSDCIQQCIRPKAARAEANGNGPAEPREYQVAMLVARGLLEQASGAFPGNL
jgi:hypothetical protein